jgi:hypothetical protein
MHPPLDPSGNNDPKKGLREFIVGTGGETLDTVALTGTECNSGVNPNFNAQNLEASSGNQRSPSLVAATRSAPHRRLTTLSPLLAEKLLPVRSNTLIPTWLEQPNPRS